MDQMATIDHITRWADADENVRVVVLTGSTARGDHDALSDVDVELYVLDPDELLDRRSWYDHFGDVLAVEELPNPGRLPTRLLYLVDGKIDFTIGDVASLDSQQYSRPVRVLVDKDARADITIVSTDAAEPPSSQDYEECVNWFSAAALMQAKLIVRHEPWAAKYRDWDLKRQLLRMIEWEHRCRHGWDYDTWYNGKHLDGWVDPHVRNKLDGCWAGFDTAEMASALRASMDLFQAVSDRTGVDLDLPLIHHDRVRDEVERILRAGKAQAE